MSKNISKNINKNMKEDTNKNSMTALVSAFALAYHSKGGEPKAFDDPLAARLVSEDEYGGIAQSMTAGINFFNPQFDGTADEALLWIVNNQLAPSPLGRKAFCRQSLANAVKIGAEQYLIFGAGYDTFAYRQPAWAAKLQIFEVDRPQMIADKKQRLRRADIKVPANVHYVEADLAGSWRQKLQDNPCFAAEKINFGSLLGVIYYLPEQAFAEFLAAASALFPKGSSLLFDYPACSGEESGSVHAKQKMMAKAAGEPMSRGYTYEELEKILAKHGFLIYEHLVPQDINQRFFKKYNQANPQNPLSGVADVNYCLAVKI